MRFCFLVALLCLGAVHAAFADPPQNESDAGAVSDESKFTFDGIWKPKGAMLSGVLIPPPALKAITLKINKNKYEVAVEGEDHSDIGMFTLDPTTTP
ncbi:hypothetical protein [Novipirellula caenicola]|uniref:Uncharacterized protein n=1 Tax=Novipirellula caenicola TaxID=1536901 RepID=A0ABP9VHJ8_9BACT